VRPAAAVTVALLACLPAAAQETEVHGEDSVFAGHGVTIAWGVLRAAAEAETQVVVRVVAPGGAYTHLDVEAVDPFTHARRSMVDAPVKLDGPVEVHMPRVGFADFPRREIRLWRAGRPALTVYYLGVPDTTPEFASEAGLRAYLDDAVAKARPAAGRPVP
jgi:hypothetical protein